MSSITGPLTVAVVGAGHRSVLYADYALSHPDRMKVVAIAEPDERRRVEFARRHNLPADRQFGSYTDLAARPGLARAAINGTMDRLHYASTVPLLEAGYDVLLEKPIAATLGEVRGLIDLARARGRIVMICHVLRYAPFYAKVKEIVDSGRIGEVVSLRTLEAVSYHHMAIGFIRGRWRKTAESNPMILSKCCHDLDIIAWLLSGVPAARVCSLGSLKQFRAENAPAGSGQRCMVDCRIEPTCQYSARLNYLDKDLWRFYAWECIEHLGGPDATREQKAESLRTDNPFGRCVWRCDNDVVDHQSVVVEFASGVTATHDMWGATSRPARTIHIIGSKGELEGDCGLNVIRVRHPNLTAARTECDEELVPPSDTSAADGHGGGDERLIADFVATVRGEGVSKACTKIEDSFTGHQIAFAAEIAMREHRVVELG